MTDEKRPRFIPAGEDGLPDESKAVPVTQNEDGSLTIHFPEKDEDVSVVGEVDNEGKVKYDHPEVRPE